MSSFVRKQQISAQIEGETFGFPSALITTIATGGVGKKFYGDDSKQFTNLALPQGFHVKLSVSNIVGFTNKGIEAAMLMLQNYQNLFKYYTKMSVNYPVELNAEIFQTLPAYSANIASKLNISFEFKHVDGKVNFSQEVSYMFSRFMIPQEPNEDLTLDSQPKLDKFKRTHLEVFDNCLKAWVKLSIPKPYNKDKAKKMEKTQENIKRILITVFSNTETPNDLLYKFACGVLFNNASMLAAHVQNKDVDPIMFNVVNMDEYTPEQFDSVVAALRASHDKLQQMLADYLANILKYKKESTYPLYKLDEDNRALLLRFISSNLLDAFTKKANKKAFQQIVNKVCRPTIQKPLGITPELIAIFESFPREKFLNFFFDERIHDRNFNPTHGDYFPLLKQYYYNDPVYKNVLFEKWTQMDYYSLNSNKAITCTEFGIFLEWCLFINDSTYTNKLFNIICNCPTDAREFVLYNIFEFQNHSIVHLMKTGGITVNGVVIVPSFKQQTLTMRDIRQLFVNFLNGVKDTKTNQFIVPPAGNEIPFKVKCPAMDLIDMI